MTSGNKLPRLIIGILLFVGLAAVPYGLMFIIDTTGDLVVVSLDALEGSPFRNFLIPGIILFGVNGLGRLLAAFFVIKKHDLAGRVIMLIGLILSSWIIIQFLVVGFDPMFQPLFFTIGIIEMVLGKRLHTFFD